LRLWHADGCGDPVAEWDVINGAEEIETMVKYGRRSIIAILAAAMLAVTGIGLGAQPARASTGVDGFTVLNASKSDTVHHCTLIGVSGDYQAVECVDIFTGPSGQYGTYWAQGGIEVMCANWVQNVTVACKTMNASGWLADGSVGIVYGTSDILCGTGDVNVPKCSSGRLTALTGSIYYSSTTGCDSYPNSYWDVWASVASDLIVTLPDGTPFSTYTGYGTGHSYICW
jgi:hypothetical protein